MPALKLHRFALHLIKKFDN